MSIFEKTIQSIANMIENAKRRGLSEEIIQRYEHEMARAEMDLLRANSGRFPLWWK